MLRLPTSINVVREAVVSRRVRGEMVSPPSKRTAVARPWASPLDIT